MGTQERRINMVYDYVGFVTQLRAMSKHLGLNFGEIDILAGVGTGTTSRYASNLEPNPKVQTFLALCNALDLDPRNFFVLEF